MRSMTRPASRASVSSARSRLGSACRLTGSGGFHRTPRANTPGAIDDQAPAAVAGVDSDLTKSDLADRQLTIRDANHDRIERLRPVTRGPPERSARDAQRRRRPVPVYFGARGVGADADDHVRDGLRARQLEIDRDDADARFEPGGDAATRDTKLLGGQADVTPQPNRRGFA